MVDYSRMILFVVIKEFCQVYLSQPHSFKKVACFNNMPNLVWSRFYNFGKYCLTTLVYHSFTGRFKTSQ